MRSGLRINLDRYKRMSDKFDRFTLRTIPHTPPYGLVVISRQAGMTAVFVRILEYRVANGDYPVISFDCVRERRWSSHFRSQFNRLWESEDAKQY